MSSSTVSALTSGGHEDREPTDAELRAIELQHPVMVAELELLDAEIAALDRPGDLDAARRVGQARLAVLTTQLDRIGDLLAAALPYDFGEVRAA